MIASRLARLWLGTTGIDPRQLRRLGALAGFWRDLRAFRRAGGTVRMRHLFPVLGEDTAGAARLPRHYFHLDLAVAREIFRRAPRRHVDFGSRVDGFVAHVAAFRDIEVLDIRPLADPVAGIRMRRADVMDAASVAAVGTTDSLSSLHVLEHVGLGRYGDPIDPHGWKRALANLVGLLEPGGTLYVAVPVAAASRVEFNAHRVFRPEEFVGESVLATLRVAQVLLVDDTERLHRLASVGAIVERFPDLHYGCGIFILEKTEAGSC